jgi:hypothetical protein
MATEVQHRSEARREQFSQFTSNILADSIYRFATTILYSSNLYTRRRLQVVLNMLTSVAYEKGFSDDEIVQMQLERMGPFSRSELRERKVINIQDFRQSSY